MNLPISCRARAHASMALLMIIMGFLSSSGWAQEKKVKVETSVTASEVEPGDEFTLRITVHGHSEIVNQALPLDMLFVVDLSSPLDEAKMRAIQGAVLRLIQLAERDGGRTAPGSIRIGLISLSSQAEIAAAPSNDFETLKASAEEIPLPVPGEPSRLLEAMKKAHGLLASSSSSAHRTVILLSEAILTSTPEAQWVDAWVSLLREAQSAGIRYYAIGLGSGSPSGLLYSMAENTGGNYYHPASFHHLEAVVSDVFAHAAYHLVASQVILREQVDLSNFEIVPDSFEFSEGMLMPSVGELASLMRTGEIIVPLGQLPSNKQRVFGFRLRVKQCLPPEHPQESATIEPSRPTSMISYRYGPTTYQEKLPAGAIRCFKLSGLFFRKDYDEQKDEVVITLQSTYRPSAMIDNTIRGIRIYDYPSFHYQYVVGSAHPPLEKFIPGAKADLLHWFFPRLSPQERMELRFKMNLAAYRPRDANPLRLGAERRPEGSESWAEFILPDKNAQKILLPQKYRYVADLPVIPEGRPDLHITPPLDEDKFYSRVPEEIDLSHITIPPEGLAALWPFPQNPFAGQETPDVWIDSEKNGFVTRWEPATDPEVVNQIKMRMQNVILNPSSGVFQGIEGQGDLFHRKQKNRIFIRIHNGGESPSPRMENGLKLSIFNYGTKDWEVLRALDLPEMPPDPSASRILFVELPSDTLKDAWLQPFGGPGKGAWTALLKVFLTPSPNEAHINNNTATEKIFVVD